MHNYSVFLCNTIVDPVIANRFDITNTEGLLKKISEEDRKAFNFDVKCVDWVNYFSDVHMPGLVKHVLK
jgi:fatty acyl-CoA reductase